MNSSPQALGMSAQRLDRIGRFLRERYVDAGRIPCAQMLVWRRGEIAHFSSYGMADIERRKPVREDTIFRIYSMTKPLASVAFMMLVEEGLVSLDTPVHRVIPKWADLGVYAGGLNETFRTQRPERPMLMLDLLRHTSGLTYGFQMSTNVDAAYRKHRIGEFEKHGTLDGWVDQLARIPLEFSPGTAWNYSVSTDIVGHIVGRLSGQPFERFVQERLLDPLGMRDTGFHVHAGKAERFAAMYGPGADGTLKLLDDPATSTFLSAPSLISGGGGLVGTTADYLRFCRMMLNGGTLDGVQYLSPKTVALMTGNHLPGNADLPALSRSMFSEAAYNGVGFGLGFSVTMDPVKTMIPGSVGEYAWGGAASTAFWIDPAEQLVAIFMTQLLPSSTYPVRRELRTLVYSALTG